MTDFRLARLGMEVLSRPVPLVYAKTLASGVVESFVHNWAGQVTMETAYQTVISSSQENSSEERRGLVDRPRRILSYIWQGMSKAATDRLLVVLRKMATNQWCIPLYQDPIYLDANYTDGPSNLTLTCTYTNRRVFVGGRVCIMAFNGDYQPTAAYFKKVDEKSDTGLVLDDNVGQDLTKSKTIIYPCIDVQYLLNPTLSYRTDRYPIIEMTLEEIYGPSALPPTQIGVPRGFYTYDNVPIFDPSHDWSASRVVSYQRDGKVFSQGRGDIFDLSGDHARLITNWSVAGDRSTLFNALRFFDWARGRLRAFWTIDPETLWTASALATSYVEVEPLGDSDDFQLDFDHVGIRMKDGTKIVRPVGSFTITPSAWRINVSSNFPSGLSVSDVLGVARARKSRFMSDAISEEWTCDDWGSVALDTIELLEEKEITE